MQACTFSPQRRPFAGLGISPPPGGGGQLILTTEPLHPSPLLLRTQRAGCIECPAFPRVYYRIITTRHTTRDAKTRVMRICGRAIHTSLAS